MTFPYVTSSQGGIPSDSDVVVIHPALFGDVKIEIEAGTFLESGVQLTVMVPSTLPAVQQPGLNAGGCDVGIDVSVNVSYQPTKNVTITIPYRDSDVAGMTEQNLVIVYFDPAHNVWVKIPSTAYPAQNKVVGTTRHFSIFRIVEAVANLSDLRVYPNPCKPGSGGIYEAAQVTFDQTTAEAEIKIFTISGYLVRTLSADVTGKAAWDMKNDAGSEVASSVYIYLVTDSAGNKKTGRIVIEK